MSNNRYMAIVNREIRRVPLDWKHPTDAHGMCIPLLDHTRLTGEVVRHYQAEGSPPEEYEAWYMPDFSQVPEEQMGIQAYETTSEGCPISPVFPDTPEGRFALVENCAAHETVFADVKATPTDWARILFGRDQAAINMETGTVELQDTLPTTN